jgi:hypothetical protein
VCSHEPAQGLADPRHRSLLTAPLRWAGLADGARRMRVMLFQDYREREKAPFLVFQVAIKVCF